MSPRANKELSHPALPCTRPGLLASRITTASKEKSPIPYGHKEANHSCPLCILDVGEARNSLVPYKREARTGLDVITPRVGWDTLPALLFLFVRSFGDCVCCCASVRFAGGTGTK